MKEFSLERAKAGDAVVTQDGKKVRVVCFDVKNCSYPILALVDIGSGYEVAKTYSNEGHSSESVSLHMAPVKKEAFVTVYTFVDGTRQYTEVYEKSKGPKNQTFTTNANILSSEAVKVDEWTE